MSASAIAPPTAARLPITAYIGAKTFTRSEVLAWEGRRATKALKRLGVPMPGGDVDERCAAIVAAKLDLGREETERRLAREVAWSDRVTAILARRSGARRRLSQIELVAPGCTAEQLPAWYEKHARADDEAVMLAACPDHHLFRPAEGGSQEVWETTGGSPICSRFFITIDDSGGLITPADPNFPVQLAGVARLANGTPIGGIRHQFRDEADGLRVRLTVEFPWLMGPIGPAAHRWHLACEFSQWIEAAAAEAAQTHAENV
jgi:hypothetical protein